MRQTALSILLLALAGCGSSDRAESDGRAVTPTPAGVRSAEPHAKESETARIGRCHMDTCSWSIERSRRLEGRNVTGNLFRLSLLGGLSSHPDGYDKKTPIKWNDREHTEYVFCSTSLPSVIGEEDGKWSADVLDFANNIYGYQESSASLYAATCHGDGEAEKWSADGWAQKHGYRPLNPDGDAIDAIPLREPSDILKIAQQMAQTVSRVPTQFHGKWAPSVAECQDVVVRDGDSIIDQVPSETAIDVTSGGFGGNEQGSTIIAGIPAPSGSYAFRAKASAVEDEAAEKLVFSMVGNRLRLQRTSSQGNSDTVYTRCPSG